MPEGTKDWKLLEVRRIPTGGGRIVCVANQKGGVAKTTTSVNLAAALAQRGHRTLIVDVDPQSNATTGVGIDHRTVERSSYDLMVGDASLNEVVLPTALDGLFCAPSSLDLAGAEIELVGSLAREHKLAEALASATNDYEIIFLDCPPSLGLITINALVAAQDLLVPVQCEYYALEGLGQLLNTAERVRRSLNPELRIAGVLLTMYDARTKLSSQVSDEVRSHFGDLVFKTVVPRSVRLSEAPSFGEPVVTLDPSSRGSISYKLLAAELAARYGIEEDSQPRPRARVSPAGTADRPATPGPGGRGYGTVTPEPDDLHLDWPRTEPWSEIDLAEPSPAKER
ncbi:MAG: chromosome partitioning protein [Actinomycetota bacterium]|nr:chromosome partitioning protein [Actinomycetota bacterium]